MLPQYQHEKRAFQTPGEHVPLVLLYVTVKEILEKLKVEISECRRTVGVRLIFDSVPCQGKKEGRLTQLRAASECVLFVIDVVGSDEPYT